MANFNVIIDETANKVTVIGDGSEVLLVSQGLQGPAGTTDHGSLTGLGDDDHTQYHNNARALTWLGTRSTNDLPEGGNLYFTAARAKSAAVADAINNGTTDVAPSQNAVFDALALKQPLDTQLTDLAALSYSGNAGKVVKVKATEDGWELGVGGGGGAWGTITGTLSDQTDLQSALDAKEDESNKSTDGTFAANSTTLYPSQSAVKTYTDAKVSDTAYDATSWNGVNDIAPSKNAVRDQVETLVTSIATKATFLSVQTLSDGANISWDLSNGHGSVTLAGNRTLDNPTNQTAGQWYILKVAQDSTGGRTLSWGSTYKWTDGIYPVLSAGANAADVFYFWSDGTNMYGTTIGFNFS